MRDKSFLSKWLLNIIVIVILGVSIRQIYEFVFSAFIIGEDSAATHTSKITNNAASARQFDSPALFEHIKVNEPSDAKNIKSQIDGNHLNLILIGVVQSNDENSGRAIIAFEEKEEIYSMGARLPGKKNVFLSKIMADHVIIINDGHEELLRLHNPKSSMPVQASLFEPSDAPKDTPSVYGPPNGYNDAQTDQPNEQVEELVLIDINRNLINVVAMSIQRLESNKQLLGYRIHPGFDVNKFNATGLHADDMITAINGIPLTKPDEILESYKKGDSAPISLEIERGDNVFTIELSQTL